MKNNTWVILTSFLMCATISNTVAAENEVSMEERLNRVERLVNSKGLVDIMVRVESMQSELQRLVGEIELQKHSLDEIKKRQRDLYIDIDRRLLQIERGSGASSSSRSSSSTITTRPISTKTKNRKVTQQSNNAVTTSTVSKPSISNPSISKSRVIKKREGEQVAYQKAFDLLRALRYEKATKAFRSFLKDFPDGRYAHIAQYWLAETSYHTRKFDVAVKDYQTLINQYPKSPKRADALLKIGYSQFELKSFSKAKTILNKLIQSYPGTTEAGQAEDLLQKIRLQKSR